MIPPYEKVDFPVHRGGAELPFGLTEDELTCVDGVLYGRDILLLYPKTRTDACFVIPDGIGYVWEERTQEP